jgi:hypothetical protein
MFADKICRTQVWSKKSHDLILSGKILITYIFGKTNHVRKFVLKKIQDPDFGENNSQDKWLLPCPLSIINFSLNWCTSFSRKRFHFFHN